MANASIRGDLTRPTGYAARCRQHLKSCEAIADRCDLKPVAAMDHNAGRQGVDADANHPWAALERPLQDCEVVMMTLPPGDFDANSVRRHVDHEGPAPG